MARVATVTVTSVIGPGLAATALVLADCSEVNFRVSDGVLRIKHGSPQADTDFDLAGIATVTYTISGVTTTVTVST